MSDEDTLTEALRDIEKGIETYRKKSDDLRKLINSSGFLFQLRVEDEISSTAEEHQWTVLIREHPWEDPGREKSGFIDLVLSKAKMRMVIECKKTKDADWVFLSKEPQRDGTLVRSQWTSGGNGIPAHTGVSNWFPEPESLISDFCVVRGHGEGELSMLERLARLLLDSVDRIAMEELTLAVKWGARVPDRVGGEPPARIYFPVIVTNARLHVCHFDAWSVSLDEGSLPSDQGRFKPVPFVRFHKTLRTRLTQEATPDTLKKAGNDMNRTVLVVQANSLTSFLKDWRLVLQTEPPWPALKGVSTF